MNFRNSRAATASALTVLLLCAASTSSLLAAEVPPGVSKIIESAEVIVVGTVERSDTLWKENGRGDRVIVTRTLVTVGETLKGAGDNSLWIDAEGGTIDGVTLRVSSSPAFKAGDRAVLFLKRNPDGAYSIEEHGRGVLKLDDRDVVRGTALALDDIRQAALARGARGRQ